MMFATQDSKTFKGSFRTLVTRNIPFGPKISSLLNFDSVFQSGNGGKGSVMCNDIRTNRSQVESRELMTSWEPGAEGGNEPDFPPAVQLC